MKEHETQLLPVTISPMKGFEVQLPKNKKHSEKTLARFLEKRTREQYTIWAKNLKDQGLTDDEIKQNLEEAATATD